MVIVPRLFFISQGANSLDDVVLRICLPRINHIVDGADPAEVRVLGFTLLSGNPDLVAVGILEKLSVSKISSQKTKLPKMIGNVFAYVGHGPVGADDHLLIFFVIGSFRTGAALHDPAILVLAFGHQRDHAFFFKQGKGGFPEMKMEYLALAGQKVVFDVEAEHGLQVPPQNGGGDQLADFSGFVSTLLDGVQAIETYLQISLVLLIPLRDAGVNVPAQVIKARLANKLFDLSFRIFLQASKADDHVGHLHAGVVNVVLHVNVGTGGAQQPNESVSQNGIAQMAHMRRLVGIDAGVLDQHLLAASLPFFGRWLSAGKRLSKCATADANVNIARARDFELFYPGYLANSGDNFFGDLARRLAQLFRQFECQRQGIFTQGHTRRLSDYDIFNIKLVLPLQKGAHAV